MGVQKSKAASVHKYTRAYVKFYKKCKKILPSKNFRCFQYECYLYMNKYPFLAL